ncbi:hypothetical protein DOY81_008425 [Sarcophaga bullata]|nr:hypothetical protein DOY81_008425 [Sarcophaga bullata]
MNSKSAVINIRILFFAKARELSGLSETNYQISSPKIIASVLLEQICSTYKLTVIRDNLIIAINESYCENLNIELQLQEGDEIAIIPPISGG